MFENRKFGFYAAALCLTGLLYSFLCAGLDGGQMQVIRAAVTPAGGGWTDAGIGLPLTVGSFLAVLLVFACCKSFPRGGVRQSLILSSALAALGCVGLVCANGLDVYGGAASGGRWLFAASLIMIRCGCAAIRLALTVLCLCWFIRARGRALGIVAMGASVFAAVGAPAQTSLVRTGLGGDYRPLYLAVALALALLALAVRFLLRDLPEEAGLYPDGDGRAPASEPAETPPPMALSRILKDRRMWLALIATGALAAAGTGCLTFLEPRLIAKGGGGPTLLNRAAPWLALGAILGIPASYVFGWLCDRLGAVLTAPLLALAELASVCLLWRFPKEVSLPTGAALSAALACLTAGPPTVIPCVLGQLFDRQGLLCVCRVPMPALLLISALAGPVGVLLGGGVRARLYAVLAAAVCLGLLACLALLIVSRPGKTPEDKG